MWLTMNVPPGAGSRTEHDRKEGIAYALYHHQDQCGDSQRQSKELKTALAVSWEKVPTKRERWLMIVMEDKQQMFFSGRDTPAAFVNFKIHGDYDIGPKNCEMLSEEFMNDLSQVLGIQKERIFVAHDVCPSWGWVDDPDPRAYGPAPV